MAAAVWKGRMQEALPGVNFDGAHNLSGIEKFLEAVKQITGESAVLLFSMVKEKEYTGAAKRLLLDGNWEEIVVTTAAGGRGVACQELAAVFRATLWDGLQETGAEALLCRFPVLGGRIGTDYRRYAE